MNKLLNKYQKGEFEYVSYDKIRTIITTFILFALSIGLYITGYVTTGSSKNLLTVVAILGMLPASKSLVSLIMKLRIKTADISLKEELDKYSDSVTGLYNIYLTSYDTNFYCDHMTVLNNSLICYTSSDKFDIKKFEAHMEKHMKLDGIKDIMIKVFTDKKAYLKRINEISALDNRETNEQLYRLICNISL